MIPDFLSNMENPLIAAAWKALSVLCVNGMAIVASLQSEIEGWLRIASLLTAITYTTILIAKALRKRATADSDGDL